MLTCYRNEPNIQFQFRVKATYLQIINVRYFPLKFVSVKRSSSVKYPSGQFAETHLIKQNTFLSLSFSSDLPFHFVGLTKSEKRSTK
jgi:hypothetical protein